MLSYSILRFWLRTAFVFYGLMLSAQALPGTPTHCIASGLGNSSGSGPATVVIQWKDNSTTETQWIIRYSTDNGTTFISPPVLASITKTTTPTLNYPWTGAITGLTYTFKIQAYDGLYGNMSAPSTPITPRPMSLATSTPPCDSVNLVWQPVTNATSYKLYYREGGSPTDLLLATEVSGSTIYQVPDALAKPGLSYQFVIKPYLGSMEIGSSNRLVHIVISMSSKSGISGAPGDVFAHTFTEVSSSTVQSRSLAGVPAGLSFNASTGSLTGTFPALGNYTLHYTVTFATG